MCAGAVGKLWKCISIERVSNVSFNDIFDSFGPFFFVWFFILAKPPLTLFSAHTHKWKFSFQLKIIGEMDVNCEKSFQRRFNTFYSTFGLLILFYFSVEWVVCFIEKRTIFTRRAEVLTNTQYSVDRMHSIRLRKLIKIVFHWIFSDTAANSAKDQLQRKVLIDLLLTFGCGWFHRWAHCITHNHIDSNIDNFSFHFQKKQKCWNKINSIFLTRLSVLNTPRLPRSSILKASLSNFQKQWLSLQNGKWWCSKAIWSHERCFFIFRKCRLKLPEQSLEYDSNDVDVNIMKNNIIIPIKYLFFGQSGDGIVLAHGID